MLLIYMHVQHGAEDVEGKVQKRSPQPPSGAITHYLMVEIYCQVRRGIAVQSSQILVHGLYAYNHVGGLRKCRFLGPLLELLNQDLGLPWSRARESAH